MNKITIPEGTQTAVFVIESNALKNVAEILKQYFPGKTQWLIVDGNTWNAAGKGVAEVIRNAGIRIANAKIFPASRMYFIRQDCWMRHPVLWRYFFMIETSF